MMVVNFSRDEVEVSVMKRSFTSFGEQANLPTAEVLME